MKFHGIVAWRDSSRLKIVVGSALKPDVTIYSDINPDLMVVGEEVEIEIRVTGPGKLKVGER